MVLLVFREEYPNYGQNIKERDFTKERYLGLPLDAYCPLHLAHLAWPIWSCEFMEKGTQYEQNVETVQHKDISQMKAVGPCSSVI